MKISVVRFNHLLESWAAQTPPIMYFTVENVLGALGLDDSFYNHVLNLLMKRNGDEINAEKLGLCPSNHKIRTFALDEEVEDYYECYCQEDEFEITKFILVFSFDKDFVRDCIKKKNKLNISKDLLVI